MVEWKTEALEAAYNALPRFFSPKSMRAALDAAVKAQGLYIVGFDCGVTKGRAEAFEEAAAIADRIAPDLPEVADAIRALNQDGGQ